MRIRSATRKNHYFPQHWKEKCVGQTVQSQLVWGWGGPQISTPWKLFSFSLGFNSSVSCTALESWTFPMIIICGRELLERGDIQGGQSCSFLFIGYDSSRYDRVRVRIKATDVALIPCTNHNLSFPNLPRIDWGYITKWAIRRDNHPERML